MSLIFFATLLTILGMGSSSAAATGLEGLSFLSGCWQSKSNGVITVENWLQPTHTVMLGVAHRKNESNQIQEYEFLRIEKDSNGSIRYSPYVNGQHYTDFMLNTIPGPDPTIDSANFENRSHDFPQVISYSRSRLYPYALQIRLEGKGEGDVPIVTEFALRRVDCNSIF